MAPAMIKNRPTLTTWGKIRSRTVEGTATSSSNSINNSINSNHRQVYPSDLGNPLDGDHTKTRTEKTEEDGVNPEVNETLIHIVTRAMTTEAARITTTKDNGGTPKKIPPYPRTTRNQIAAQPLAK